MKTQADQSPSLAGIDTDQFWYVPDRRVRTKGACAAAIAIAEWIAGRHERGNEPDEQELFASLHTCAYRAVRRPRGRKVPDAEREEWARRWQIIREHIVEQNLGLVYSMIKRFHSRKIDEDDLLSDAMLGLTRAVDRFNPWKGYRFSTYACNVIARALMRRGRRERRYRQLFPVNFEVSFEQPDEMPDLQTDLYVERLHRVLDHNLGELTRLESSILARRFPSGRNERQTFQEIGETVGLSKERVRQIQNIALRKLRTVLAEDAVLQ
jgi:RNA polymerase primary sigma factor